MNYLREDRRNDLVALGRRGKREKGDGKTRYEKRVKSRVASSVKEFNSIDMTNLFKHGILTVNVPVVGETNSYTVRIRFGSFLDELQQQIERQNGQLNLRAVTRALLDAFNRDDVYISCSCADWKYRGAYWATVGKITSGAPETRISKITNPDNDLGPGCKHIMLVLANNSWLIKVASVILNYVIYMERNQKKLYADIIYPAIYGKKYEDPVQLSLDDKDELDTDSTTLDAANAEGRVRGQFKQGNQYRYQPKSGPGKGQIDVDSIIIDEE